MDLRYCSSFNDKKERGNYGTERGPDNINCRPIGGHSGSVNEGKLCVQKIVHIVKYVYACYTERRKTPREVRKVRLELKQGAGAKEDDRKENRVLFQHILCPDNRLHQELQRKRLDGSRSQKI